jgi:hypothetical protein
MFFCGFRVLQSRCDIARKAEKANNPLIRYVEWAGGSFTMPHLRTAEEQ